MEANGAHNATLRVAVVRNRGGLFEGSGIEREFETIAFTTGLHAWGKSVKLAVEEQARHGASRFAGVKVTSWIQNLTWLERAKATGCDEVVLLNEHGRVSECTSANIFAVTADGVWTPPLSSGCLPGVTRSVLLTAELAARGADVVAVDISPQLIGIAQSRLSADHQQRVRFASGDMLAESHGWFDYVMAMDSLIYYTSPDIAAALDKLGERTAEAVVFTVAPRTPFLMTFFTIGKAFPRSDRSPVMIPQAFTTLNTATKGRLTKIERVTSGFYISECLEFRP